MSHSVMAVCVCSMQVKPMLAIWRAEEDLKDRDVSG